MNKIYGFVDIYFGFRQVEINSMALSSSVLKIDLDLNHISVNPLATEFSFKF